MFFIMSRVIQLTKHCMGSGGVKKDEKTQFPLKETASPFKKNFTKHYETLNGVRGKNLCQKLSDTSDRVILSHAIFKNNL